MKSEPLSVSLDFSSPLIAAARADAAKFGMEVSQFVISDADSKSRATALGVAIAERRKQIQREYRDWKDPLVSLGKKVDALFSTLIDGFSDAEKSLGRKLGAFEAAELKRRQEEADKLRREKEEEARLERVRLENEKKKLEEDLAKARALAAPPPAPEASPAKVDDGPSREPSTLKERLLAEKSRLQSQAEAEKVAERLEEVGTRIETTRIQEEAFSAPVTIEAPKRIVTESGATAGLRKDVDITLENIDLVPTEFLRRELNVSAIKAAWKAGRTSIPGLVLVESNRVNF